MIVIRVCWRSQWHTLHTRSRAQCAQVTLPIIDHRRQRGTFPFLQLLLEHPHQGQSSSRILPVVILLQQLPVIASSSTDGSGATILVVLPWPKTSGSGSDFHRRSRCGRTRGGGAGIDLLVDVCHFSGDLRASEVVPERDSGPVPWPSWRGRWRFCFFLLGFSTRQTRQIFLLFFALF